MFQPMRIWRVVSRVSTVIVLSMAVLACGSEPDEEDPPPGLSDIEVSEKTEDCYVSHGGTTLLGDNIGPVRVIARSPCKASSYISVSHVRGLESLWFLRGIESVDTTLSISGNSELETLEGPEDLRSANQIDLKGNASLRSLEGLKGLERLAPSDDPLAIEPSIPGSIEIRGSPNLRTLDGLENLTEATSVVISNCDSLRSIEALYGIGQLEGLTIIKSPVPRCQIEQLISEMEYEPPYLDIKAVGSGTCE